MDNKKLNKISCANLAIAYLMFLSFMVMILVGMNPETVNKEIAFNSSDTNKTKTERVVHYTERNNTIVLNSRAPIYHDKLEGVVIDEDRSFLNIPIKNSSLTEVIPANSLINSSNYENRTFRSDVLERGLGNHVGNSIHRGHRDLHLDSERNRQSHKLDSFETISFEEALARHKIEKDNSIGLNNDPSEKKGLDFSKLTPVSNGGDLTEDSFNPNFNKPNLGNGLGGDLYAYNYPSKGVGAGVGTGGLGASIGQAAGIGAGIGEGILNGETVPTLGGIGDGAKTIYGEPAEAVGVGGLIGGAGAGGAAGLTQGYITEKLGVGKGSGLGYGAGSSGGEGYNYDHLPENGSLHIMIHVDGSGSILNTRKQLDIMKNTLLKDALLPYYNNDESLYSNRVSIIDNSGERTLRFFSKASERKNVLAVAFQDEAQPSYHLPNFNKKPEDHYLDDLKVLKGKLNNHQGVYRGILFQVDRGKTFAKSFKEFVGNAFQGKGYLKNQNLKNYYWQNNTNNIKRKNGIVFSDEYHAKDQGDPQYYLDLLFEASKKVGLDLNIYGNGLKDGINYKK